ncbi:hypothetical protein V494_02777 [Pseudogymnoascus sp. VKM F-4513 (FW-928)]|nr:hypothetical protein V494_02777 [Pseudogymnoascus sp. VKM F-4513 (FW-928)]
MAQQPSVYTTDHATSVLQTHKWRTVANSAAYLIPYLKPGMTILDIGCGPGSISIDLARLTPDSHVTGIDVADPLAEARASAVALGVNNVEFKVGDIHALDFPDDSFDVVHVHQVLQHISDPVKAIREMRRVAKPGGIVAARESASMEWFPESAGITAWRDITGKVSRAKGGNPHPGSGIHSWAREAGFERSQITCSTGSWCFSSNEERAYWGGSMAERALSSGFAKIAVDGGYATMEELKDISNAWLDFVDDDNAWFGLLHGEINVRFAGRKLPGAMQAQRHASQAQSRLPKRMSLSPRVAQPNPRTSESGKPVRRRQDGPFGGMNLKEAGIRGVPEFQRTSRTDSKGNDREGGKTNRREGYHALKMQRALAPVSYNSRTAVKERLQQIDSFKKFQLLPSVQESIEAQALKGLEDVMPTAVQRLTIPALLGEVSKHQRKKTAKAEREDFLIAAETGSGKTLSYLLPVIDAVKRAEQQDADVEEYNKMKQEEELKQNNLTLVSPPLTNMPHPTTGRPRAVILLPTSELVSQVGTLLKSLSHTVKFRSALISSSVSGKVIRNRLFSPGGVDILVSTPHLLASIAESDPNILSRVTHLVIDEADSLLDRGFSPLTSEIIDKSNPSLQQLILCSATIPRSLDSFLRKRFPDIRRLTTPNLHAIPRRVQLGVVDVERDPYRENKNLACADTIWSIGKSAADHEGPDKNAVDLKHVLVFVNEREKTQEVAEYLVTKGINAVALSRDTPEHRASEILADFTSSEKLTVPRGENPGSLADNQPNYLPFGQEAPPSKRNLPNMKVLVTTDLGSRGIDTLAVRHVILYDVPHSTIDFIHRLGRTGRMGRRGRGIVLVGKNDRKDVVREVKEGMFKGQALI